MKKVINGKLYDTATAKLLGRWDNGFYGDDYGHCEESLYKTLKGAYFLAGEGGPMSKYAKSCGCGGTGIEVIEESVAMAWLEKYGEDGALLEFFDVVEG